MITGDDYFDSKEFKNLLKDFESRYDNGEVLFYDLDNLIDFADYYNLVNDGDRENAAIDTALLLYPNAAMAVAYKAHMAISNNKLEEAKRLLAQTDDTEDYQYLLAKIELTLAENNANTAFDMAKEMVENMNNTKDKHDAAIDTANIMIDYEHDDMAEALITLINDNDGDETNEVKARIAICRHDYQTAINILDSLLSKYPFSKKYWTSMTTSQYFSGNINDAMDSCNYLLAIDPDDPIGIYTKATMMEHLENYKEASILYDRYLALPNHGPEALLDHAECKINMLAYKDAIALCKQFINEADNSRAHLIGEAYYTLIMTYMAIGDKDNAKAARTEGDSYLNDNQKLVIDTKLFLEKIVSEGNGVVFDNFMQNNKDNVEMLMLAFDTAYDHSLIYIAYKIMEQILILNKNEDNKGYGFMAQLCCILGYTDEMVKYLDMALKKCRTELINVMSVAELEDMIKCEQLTDDTRQQLQIIISNKQQTE